MISPSCRHCGVEVGVEVWIVKRLVVQAAGGAGQGSTSGEDAAAGAETAPCAPCAPARPPSAHPTHLQRAVARNPMAWLAWQNHSQSEQRDHRLRAGATDARPSPHWADTHPTGPEQLGLHDVRALVLTT